MGFYIGLGELAYMFRGACEVGNIEKVIETANEQIKIREEEIEKLKKFIKIKSKNLKETRNKDKGNEL